MADVIRDRLDAFDGDFKINIIEKNDSKKSIAIEVTWGETIFDRHIEKFELNLNVDLFMHKILEKKNAGDLDVIFNLNSQLRKNKS